MQPIGLFDCTPSGEIALSPSLDTLPTKPTPQHFAPPTPPYALYPDAYPSSASVYQQAATTLYPDVSACTNPAVLPNGILPTQQSQTLWPPTLESTQAHQSETTSLHEPPLDLFDISLANGIIDCGGPPLATSSNPFLPDLAKPDAQLAQLALLSSDFQNPEVFSDQNRHEISSVHRHPQPHTFNS